MKTLSFEPINHTPLNKIKHSHKISPSASYFGLNHIIISTRSGKNTELNC